jgi:hypothetical protein
VPFAVVIALVIGVAVAVGLVILAPRVFSQRGRGTASSGFGNALAEINEMLQPQQPAVEMFQKDVDREHDDDGAPR